MAMGDRGKAADRSREGCYRSVKGSGRSRSGIGKVKKMVGPHSIEVNSFKSIVAGSLPSSKALLFRPPRIHVPSDNTAVVTFEGNQCEAWRFQQCAVCQHPLHRLRFVR